MMAQLIVVVIFLDELFNVCQFNVNCLKHDAGFRRPVVCQKDPSEIAFGDSFLNVVLVGDVKKRQLAVGGDSVNENALQPLSLIDKNLVSPVK